MYEWMTSASGMMRMNQSWVATVIDLLVVFLIIYEILKLVQDTRATQMAAGVAIVALLYQLSRWMRLNTLEFVMRQALVYIGFGVIVLFQNEIRTALTHFGNNLRNPFTFRSRREKKPQDSFDEVILAATTFAAQKTGALIVFERNVGLQEYINRGVKMDAVMSYDLLVNIFNTNAPLHDGAVILRNRRIAAASCFLPLTLNPRLSKELGTRHRAAIGITEESDAFVVVVSEETGVISCVERGHITRNLDSRKLRNALSRAMDLSQVAPSPRRLRRRALAEDSATSDVSVSDTTMTPPADRETPPQGVPALIGSDGKRRIRERGAIDLWAFVRQSENWRDAIRGGVRAAFFRNGRLKLIAAALTAALWLSAAHQDQVPFIVRGVPVSFRDIRSDLTISNEETTREVTLRVQGPRDVVERLRPESFSIVVPLGGKSPGDRVVRLRDDAAIEKPANIEILEIDPPRLTISLEHQVERQIDIQPSFRGEPPSDFHMVNYRVTPQRATLRGPESRVFSLQSAGTETIWLSVHSVPFTEKYKIDVKDPRIEIIGAEDVEVYVDIQPVLVRRRLDVIVEVPELARPMRTSVEVEGFKSVVEKLKPEEVAVAAGEPTAEKPDQAPLTATLPDALAAKVKVLSVTPPTAPLKKR